MEQPNKVKSMRYKLRLHRGEERDIKAVDADRYLKLGLFKVLKQKAKITILVISEHARQLKHGLVPAITPNKDAYVHQGTGNVFLFSTTTEFDYLPTDVARQLRSILGKLIRLYGQAEAA